MIFQSVFGGLFLAYAASTVFLPKLPLPMELSGVYPMELVCAAISLILLVSGRLRLASPVQAYLAFMAVCLVSWMPGAIFSDEPNWKSLLLIIRFTAMILLIPVGQRFREYFTEKRLSFLLASQLVFVAITSGYVIYNMIIHPLPIEFLSGLYTQQYRLIGFTGHALTETGIMEIGHTSVQMGVYVSILALIQLSVFLAYRRTSDFIAFGILCLGTSLTYSRSGMAVLVLGIGYLAMMRSRLRSRILLGALIAAPLVLIALQFTESWDVLTSYGTFGKIFSRGLQDSKRLVYWSRALDYLGDYPGTLLIGSGYGTLFSIFGFGTLESLLFDTLFESGIFAFVLLMLFFHRLWKTSAPPASGRPFCYADAVLLGIHTSIPGLVFACATGGNTLQTDFVAPVLFLTIGICYGHRAQSAQSSAAAPTRPELQRV